MSESVHDPLTAFQVEVTAVFFSLDASDGFLLAGGAALVAQHLTIRPTYALDFFTRQGGGDVLAKMFGSLSRFADEQLPIALADVPALRVFFAEWAEELKAAD